MHPVCHWTLQSISVRRDLFRELSLESWEDIIEGQSVCCEVHPSRVGSKDGKGLSGPETIGLAPEGNIWVELLHVGGQGWHVVFPVWCAAISVKVLLEDAGPLAARNVLVNSANGLGAIHASEVHASSELNVGLKLLVSFVVAVIKRTSLVLDHSREPVHVC